MANTYHQIYIQAVFAVKNRDALILPTYKDELCKYITGIFKNKEQKLLAINSMPDHIHIFFGLAPKMRLSDLIADIKSDSSYFINDKKFLRTKFNWQEGYGVFSYSQSQKDVVIKYIMNQEEHHKKQTFREEYYDFLKKFNIEHDDRYVFDFFD